MSDRRNKGIDIKSFIFGFLVTIGSASVGYYLIGAGASWDIAILAGSGALVGFPSGYLGGDSS